MSHQNNKKTTHAHSKSKGCVVLSSRSLSPPTNAAYATSGTNAANTTDATYVFVFWLVVVMGLGERVLTRSACLSLFSLRVPFSSFSLFYVVKRGDRTRFCITRRWGVCVSVVSVSAYLSSRRKAVTQLCYPRLSLSAIFSYVFYTSLYLFFVSLF